MSEKPVIVSASAVASDVVVTEGAKAHFISTLKKTPGAKGMRLTVNTKGCSGYKYELQQVSEVNSSDLSYGLSDDYCFYVAVDAFKYVAGTTVELQQEGLNSKIVFNNPRANNLCGCGESFNVDEER